jgi:hypothetical protein
MISDFDAAWINRVELSSGCWYDAGIFRVVAGFRFLFSGETPVGHEG